MAGAGMPDPGSRGKTGLRVTVIREFFSCTARKFRSRIRNCPEPTPPFKKPIFSGFSGVNRKKGRWGVGQGQITGPGSGSSSVPAARPLENPIAFARSPVSDPGYFQLRTDILRLEYTG